MEVSEQKEELKKKVLAVVREKNVVSHVARDSVVPRALDCFSSFLCAYFLLHTVWIGLPAQYREVGQRFA